MTSPRLGVVGDATEGASTELGFLGSPIESPAESAEALGLSVHSLTVRIGGRTLVQDSALTVPRGRWTALVGPNGAGKSTLLRAVLGLIPSTGDVRAGGVVLSTLGTVQRARLIAYAPQTPTLPTGMTVVDYVGLGRTAHLRPLQAPGSGDRAVIDESIDRLDLGDFRRRLVQTLSGGERQRVVLARALAQEAKILLLDEPTSALDLGHAQMVLDLIDALRLEAGLTVLSCLHDLGLAAAYADQIVLMTQGRVVDQGEPSAVLTSEALVEHYRARAQVVKIDGRLYIHPVRSGRSDGEHARARDVGDTAHPPNAHDRDDISTSSNASAGLGEPGGPVLGPGVSSAVDLASYHEAPGHRRACLQWNAPPGWRMLSSGVAGGGLGPRRWWINAQVSIDYRHLDPERHATDIAAQLGLSGAGVGMLTAADVTRHQCAQVEGVEVCATVGLGTPTWAYRARGGTAEGPAIRRPGTINLLIRVPVPLADAALVNLVITATEAKTQALLAAGVRGTGTASDSICIAAPEPVSQGPVSLPSVSADPKVDLLDPDLLYGGPRSTWGQRVAEAVHRAVTQGTTEWLGLHGEPPHEAFAPVRD